MIQSEIDTKLKSRIAELEDQLEEAHQLIDAIKSGEVDAFAVNLNDHSEVFTLQSGDYAYRLLIEEFNEGALNLSESGMIVYTNAYFSKLTGISYEEIIGSSIFNYIQIQSREKFDTLFYEAHQGKSKGEINLQIGERVIPVYISLTSLQPKLSTIGIIITDLTEKKQNEDTLVKYQKQLEQKNHELEQRNIELASFTYVASHDLKEPLRKIQIFSSRILDKEPDQLPYDVKDNFNRILAATKRMQNLIVSLLNYSQATETKNVYAKTDLNQVLEEVKSGFSENIQGSSIRFESDVLPTLNVIPDQFNQLFSNIIGNSIKYRKPEIELVIKINITIVSAHEISADLISHHEKYLEISITDNGIGFDQQFTDKVFELFQRLHPRSIYEGTGIGLAICKKIMYNHDGFIKAKSTPGIGTTISIYLPFDIT